MGMEILPSGDMPVTAKIYKIKQLYDKDSARISFKFSNYDIVISISGRDYKIESDEKTLVPVFEQILEDNADESLAKKVYLCLDEINKQGKAASDLININIPFADGPLKDTKNSFVIFDTPGSNSATFKDHFSILEDAMKNMSNGIPIYVAEFNSLDTCDNKNLFTKIKEINQIDSRFTMIVVNKADSANIKEKSFDSNMEQAILGQSVPSNLYSGGIYFISSIMGLGSKNNGDFIDDHAAEFYEDNNRKYSNPDSRWYKELYKYDIMPEQIKQSIVNESQNADNAIYANSGLLAIEHEIVNFAEKYSAYDKCKQSNKYIEHIIDVTQEELELTQEACEKKRDELNQQLEKDKKDLVSTLENKSNELTVQSAESYNAGLSDELSNQRYVYSDEDMKTLESDILHQKQNKYDYSKKMNNVKKSGASIISKITEIHNKSMSDYFSDIGDSINHTLDNAVELRNARIASDKDTVDEIIKEVSSDYDDRLNKAIQSIDNASRQYWENSAQDVKQILLKIVMDSTTLDDDKKEELSNIIITYRDIEFKDENVFQRADFEKKVRLLWMVIDLNKINTKKLTESYNAHYSKAIDEAYEKLKQNHKRCFATWRKLLVAELRNNIVKYNPRLLGLSKLIEEETAKIEELEDTESTLQNYSEEIMALMDWEELA